MCGHVDLAADPRLGLVTGYAWMIKVLIEAAAKEWLLDGRFADIWLRLLFYQSVLPLG